MTSAFQKKLLDAMNFEIWLGDRYGVDLTKGDTTPAQRRQRARQLILKRNIAQVMIGADKKRRSIGQAFADVYGEPLEQHENGDGV